MANQKIEALEGRFSTQANSLHEKFLDLNVGMSDIAAVAKGIMNMRNQLMTMYGVPADTNWKAELCATPGACVGLAAGAGSAGAGGPSKGEVSSYKMVLHQAIAKEKKASPGKGDIEYTTTGDAASGGFSCTVVSAKFLTSSYSTTSLHPNKKEAENAAAMAAVQGDYAGHFTAVAVAVGQGTKRKAESAAAPAGPNTKAQIHQMMQLVLTRPLTKEDIVYQTETLADKTFVTTLTFPGYDATQAFQGSPCGSKKDADQSAAEAALPWLSAVAPAKKAKAAKPGKPQGAPAQPRAVKAGAAPAQVFAAKVPGAQRPMGQARAFAQPAAAMGGFGGGFGGGFW